MRGKVLPLLFAFVILLGGAACSKKQTESSQASPTQAAQTPPAQPPAVTPPAQPASTTPAPPVQPSAPKATVAAAKPSAAKAPPEPASKPEEPRATAVPAGTTLVVRLNNGVSSKTAAEGDTFTATLTRPVVVGGETLIPKGAEVTGRVTAVKAAGKLAGAAQMGLTLTSITIGGQSYDVSSNTLSQTSTGKGKRTAVLGGGGAGLGAIVGGLAGGGKGALIGALAGGGAGTAGSAFTGNANINFPAESVLSFRLSQPLDLSKSRP